MERRRFDGAAVPSDPANCSASARPTPSLLQSNYSCKKVQESLKRLASIDLIELCNEAKFERCRATRDLRSCGRYVQSMLNSCGHASLCEECNQRCDICPICRIPIPKNGNRLRLRLYYECIEAGLISKRCDDRFQENEDEAKHLTADVQRLYSLFDVALENNLVALVCHYVTDVCMDESAVSSDPVIAFLLDEVVVKDWCKRTFKNIMSELQVIYNLPMKEMQEWLSTLLKFSVKLAGILNVLEVLDSSFKGTLSAQLHDLHDMQDSISKTKQHLEMMCWCIRHQFLENVKSRWDADFASWRSAVRERKLAAIKRAWPDSLNHAADSIRQDMSALFIEDALANLDSQHEYANDARDETDIISLQKDGSSLNFQSKMEGMAGCYPFENLRAATDLLFLRGSSDLVVAKQAIFLYYLFDRHWKVPDEKWRFVIDDFAATFGITRHSLLESFTFYLLDDHTDEALQEACRLLPEISGPATHPKVSRVLLDRQNPDAALLVLRCSGRDSGVQLISLGEAVTAVRIRVECGLLTEAFMYQRTLCTKLKENKLRLESSWDDSVGLKDDCQSWENWVEVLVTEICCLCIRRNLVDRMIEFPWNYDEEKYLHKCLLDFAIDDPSKSTGSLLVVFYLQRYRYIEAYQVDRKLHNAEQKFISGNSVSEELLSRMKAASHWRSGLVEKSIELLPEVQRQQVKTGKLPEVVLTFSTEIDVPETSHHPKVHEPNLTSLLVTSSVDSFMVGQLNKSDTPSNQRISQTPFKQGQYVNSYAPTNTSQPSIFFSAEDGLKPKSGISKNFHFDTNTPVVQRASLSTLAPLKDFNSSSRVPHCINLQDDLFNELTPDSEQNGFMNQFQSASPYSRRIASNTTSLVPNTLTSLDTNGGLFKDSGRHSNENMPGKSVPWDSAHKARNLTPDNFMDISWSHEQESASVEVKNMNGGPRWRSDDASEDEQQQSPDRITVQPYARPIRAIRRSRLTR